MVGGKVINVVALQDNIWVQCQDGSDTCAIRVAYSQDAAQIKAGDLVWWQSGYAYWTPAEGKRFDVRLDRCGYSHRTIPADVMAAVMAQEPDHA
jgi:hypothetical protein